ncbi:M24 family metallopeptidase [Gordonia jinhuaensis]|uniref:M24 family metallopeptidase n=1 Tax=Gordonia jinhuaensis TaxID=1517702 RepID=UPI00166C6C2F|nr:Xaa-Pro peptidase family protein [Gordonia jinhuaensis]
MVHDHGARRERLRSVIRERELGAFVVADLLNVEYLTGFTGSNAAVMIAASGADDDHISTDGRYLTQVAEQTPDVHAVIARDCVAELVGLAGASVEAIGFEAHIVTVAGLRDLHARLSDTGPSDRLVATTGLVEGLREVKDPGEVELLRRACAVADDALAAILPTIAAGRTEREVARALEWEMFARGADEISFETIVAAGANSAIPHHRPTEAVLAAGDLVKIDFGATVAGYHSDMTRTYVLGEPAGWQREIYELVAAAQRAGSEAMVPGAALADIDAAARSVIDAAGFGEYYVHGLGHGVGLEIHEAPGVGKTATGTLPCGAVVTAEPGVYLPGRGGVRIEDTLAITDAGREVLTTTGKALTVL